MGVLARVIVEREEKNVCGNGKKVVFLFVFPFGRRRDKILISNII